jgi:hypothetical protein
VTELSGCVRARSAGASNACDISEKRRAEAEQVGGNNRTGVEHTAVIG